MKSKKTLTIIRRCLLLGIPILFLAFITGNNKSKYKIPIAAYSVTASDIDMDGDNDIIVGHRTAFGNTNPTITLLENTNSGVYTVLDTSIIFDGYQENIFTAYINNDSYLDIVSFMSDFSSGMVDRYVRIFYNNNGNIATFNDYSLNSNETFSDISYGDINGDTFTDIIIASNHGKFWGVMYNDGVGNFTSPDYHYVNNYSPTAIACGDLNNDNRDDIVVCGQSTEVYFSYANGFQPLLLETNNFKQGVSIVDFDLDGDKDILTFVGIPLVGVTSLITYQNQGNNIFDTLPEFYFQSMSSRFFVTDFNNDSLKDILFQLSDKSGYIIYYNQGNFQLADSQFVALPPSSPQEGWRNCYCEDMDGNGYIDIITIKTLYVNLPDNLEILFNDGNGNFQEHPVTGIQPPNTEVQASGLNCYPNPFTSQTTINTTIETTGFAQLQVFDLNGKLVNTLMNNDLQKGNYSFKWNGTNNTGKEVTAGVYIIKLIAGKQNNSCKIIYNK